MKYEIDPDFLTKKSYPSMLDRYVLLNHCVNELADLNDNIKELARVIQHK